MPRKNRQIALRDAARGSDCRPPATNTNGPSGKPARSLRSASDSVFIPGNPARMYCVLLAEKIRSKCTSIARQASYAQS